jgi:hypothetical protein
LKNEDPVVKIKMDTANNLKILVVSDEVNAKDLGVLKAGLTRLFQMENLPVLLDVTGVTAGAPSLPEDLKAAKTQAETVGARFLFAAAAGSPLAAGADGASLEEIKKKALTPLTPEELEKLLKTRLDVLTKTRDQLNARLEAASKDGGDLKGLKRENSDLRLRILRAERLIPEEAKDIRTGGDVGELGTRERTLVAKLNETVGKEVLEGGGSVKPKAT